MTNSLQDDVLAWLERITEEGAAPDTIVAFNIGLIELWDGYCAYLTGADYYEDDDDDWTCCESFTPNERFLPLHSSRYQITSWEAMQRAMVSAVSNALAVSTRCQLYFASATAITVGFDDGDLIRIR